MFYSLAIPSVVEQLLKITNNSGNMGLHGIFLELYYKRNLFYISLFSLIGFYFLNYLYIGAILVFVSFCLFLQSYMKWKKVIEYILSFKKVE